MIKTVWEEELLQVDNGNIITLQYATNSPQSNPVLVTEGEDGSVFLTNTRYWRVVRSFHNRAEFNEFIRKHHLVMVNNDWVIYNP